MNPCAATDAAVLTFASFVHKLTTAARPLAKVYTSHILGSSRGRTAGCNILRLYGVSRTLEVRILHLDRGSNTIARSVLLLDMRFSNGTHSFGL